MFAVAGLYQVTESLNGIQLDLGTLQELQHRHEQTQPPLSVKDLLRIVDYQHTSIMHYVVVQQMRVEGQCGG